MTRLSYGLSAAAMLAMSTSMLAAADAELLVLEWSGYEEEGFTAGYVAQHGEEPSFSFFGDEEEAFQKLRSGFRADVSHPCPQSVSKWQDAGLIEPWDISKIPNYEFVGESFKTDPTFVQDGNVYFIPADQGATAIAYNTEQVSDEQVSSLQVFLDPAFAGRISLPDVVDDAYALAFLATGVSDWTTATMDDLERASEWLRKAHQNVRAYWTDGAELAQLMTTGEVIVAWAWNETPAQLVDEGVPIGFQRQAAEGSSLWFCGYVNLVDGPGSEDKAHDFVNQWLSPETAEYILYEWGYGHGNAEAMASFPTEDVAAAGMGPIAAPLLEQLPMDRMIREKMIEEFELIKAGF